MKAMNLSSQQIWFFLCVFRGLVFSARGSAPTVIHFTQASKSLCLTRVKPFLFCKPQNRMFFFSLFFLKKFLQMFHIPFNHFAKQQLFLMFSYKILEGKSESLNSELIPLCMPVIWQLCLPVKDWPQKPGEALTLRGHNVLNTYSLF